MRIMISGKPIYVSYAYETIAPGEILTRCMFVDEDENLISFGEAIKSPKDQFVKRLGRKIAFTRALRNSGASREERIEAWKKYISLHGTKIIKTKNPH